MATTVVTKSGLQRQPGAYDRVFYSTIAIAMALTVLAGFARTYYLKLLSGGPLTTLSHYPFDTLIHAHAFLFTSWVVLFIAQTALVASHRVAVHRRLGIFGGILAAAMVMVGTSTAITAARRGGGPPGVDPLVFLAVPLSDMLLFTTFVSTALFLRRNKESHKRLMLLAYISILAAAVARLPGLLPMGPLVFFGLAFVFLLAAVLYDWISRRRVHNVYLWGGTALVLSVPLRLAISGTAGWKGLAEFLTK
jgi:hypothetical protein